MGIILFLLATISLSAIIGLFYVLANLPNKRRDSQSWDLFIDVCFGGFIGGILGSIVGLIVCEIAVALTPEPDGLMMGVGAFGYIVFTFLICWFIGILAGAVKVASKKNNSR
ncbi:MAG: hypothetical protein AAF298_16925 [Cyanobacteria bacterium P01_A01_bin.40]